MDNESTTKRQATGRQVMGVRLDATERAIAQQFAELWGLSMAGAIRRMIREYDAPVGEERLSARVWKKALQAADERGSAR